MVSSDGCGCLSGEEWLWLGAGESGGECGEEKKPEMGDGRGEMFSSHFDSEDAVEALQRWMIEENRKLKLGARSLSYRYSCWLGLGLGIVFTC